MAPMAALQQTNKTTKTQRALMRALLKLLEEKQFQRITVQEICSAASVSRSAFYLHFEDKHALLLFCLHEERERFKALAKPLDSRAFFAMFLGSIKERGALYKNLLLVQGDMELVRIFKAQFEAFIAELLEMAGERGEDFSVPAQVMAAFYSGGLAALVLWWVENDFECPAEEMASYHDRLLEQFAFRQ